MTREEAFFAAVNGYKVKHKSLPRTFFFFDQSKSLKSSTYDAGEISIKKVSIQDMPNEKGYFIYRKPSHSLSKVEAIKLMINGERLQASGMRESEFVSLTKHGTFMVNNQTLYDINTSPVSGWKIFNLK